MFLKQKVGKPEKPGEPGTIRTHDLELLNSLSTYLRQEDVDEAEDEVVVQRGPLVQQDGLDVLQESVRLKKHHDELPVDLLQGKRPEVTNYKKQITSAAISFIRSVTALMTSQLWSLIIPYLPHFTWRRHQPYFT